MASPVESTGVYEQDSASYDWLIYDWDSGDDMYRNVQGTYEVELLPQGFYGVQLRQVLSQLSGNQQSIIVLPVGGGPEIEEVFIEPGPGQFRRSPLPTGRLEFNIAQLGESYVIKYVTSGTLTGKGYIQNLIDQNPLTLALLKSFYLNWDARTSDGPVNMTDCAWGEASNGTRLFVIVSADESDDVAVSRDGGLNWTTEDVSVGGKRWRGIAFGADLFVAVGDGATANSFSCIMTSPGLGAPITWTQRTSPSKRHWRGITFGESIFVAVGYSIASDTDTVMTSPDGITWTARTAIAGDWEDVAYGGGTFVAVRSSGATRVMTSLDGITWTARTVSLKSWRRIAYGDGFFVAVNSETSTTTQVMRSDDGINWEVITTDFETSGGKASIAYGNGVFVVGLDGGSSLNGIMISADGGATWHLAEDDVGSAWAAIGYGDGVFVAGSDLAGDIMISLRAAESG